MPKIPTKKVEPKRLLKTNKVIDRSVKVGSVVRVVTEYRVIGFVDLPPSETHMVRVEDGYGDRILNFRLEEIQSVKE